MGNDLPVADPQNERGSSTPTKHPACRSRHPFARVPARYTANYFKHRLGGLTQLCRTTKERLMALRLEQTSQSYKVGSSVESLHVHRGAEAPAMRTSGAPGPAQFWEMPSSPQRHQSWNTSNSSASTSSGVDQSPNQINLRGGWGSPGSQVSPLTTTWNGARDRQSAGRGGRSQQNQRSNNLQLGRAANTSAPAGNSGWESAPSRGSDGWGNAAAPHLDAGRNGKYQGLYRSPRRSEHFQAREDDWASPQPDETLVRSQEWQYLPENQPRQAHSHHLTSDGDGGSPAINIKWNHNLWGSPPPPPRHATGMEKEEGDMKYPYHIPKGTLDCAVAGGNDVKKEEKDINSTRSEHDCWSAGSAASDNAHHFGCCDATILVMAPSSPTYSTFLVCQDRMEECALRWNVLQDITAENTPQSSVTYMVDTYDSDVVKAMRLFLSLVHNQYDSADYGHHPLRQLALLTQISSYFGAMPYIGSGYVVSSQLDMLWKHGFDKVNDWDLLLFVSRELRTHRELFAEVAARIAFLCELNEDGCFVFNGLEGSAPLASITYGTGCPTTYIGSMMIAIHEQIKLARLRAISEIFNRIGCTIDMLTVSEAGHRACKANQVSDKRRRTECEALHLGFLLKGLVAADLWPLPEVEEVTMSVKALLSAIEGIDVPRFSRIHIRQGNCQPLQKLQQVSSLVVERLCKEIDFPQTE